MSDSGDVQNIPKRFSLVFDPAIFVIDFVSVKDQKLKRRMIRPRHFDEITDCESIADDIIAKNSDILQPGKYSRKQIVSLVQKLKEHFEHSKKGSNSLDEELKTIDLNKLPTDKVEQIKQKMDGLFYSNQLKPGDPGFVYDSRVDFESTPKEPSDWDD